MTVAGAVQPRASGRTRLFARIPTVGAGIVDVAASSAATFVCGLFAARLLSTHVLGAYALAFRALVLAMTIPAQLAFQPREVQAMHAPEQERLRLLLPGFRIGLPVAIVGALTAALWPLTWPGGVPSPTIAALNVSMCAVAVLSPIQDFLRRMLHMGGRSWQAATVSLVQLAVVSAGIASAAYAAAPVSWVPFGVLALANAVSLGFGIWAAREAIVGPAPAVPDEGLALLRAGGWLLAAGLLPAVAAVAVGAIVARISGPDALGYAEAARIAAQPIFVLAIGLSAVMGPRSVRAAQSGDRAAGRRISRRVTAVIVGLGVAYAIGVGIPYRLNAVQWLVPRAFAIPGLALLTIVAHLVMSTAGPERSELLGAQRVRFLAGAEAAANGARVGCAFLAGTFGVYALPIGLFVQGAIRAVLVHREVGQMYKPTSAMGSGVTSAASDSDIRTDGLRLLLLDEDQPHALHVAVALRRLGHTVDLLSATGFARRPYAGNGLRVLAAPPVQHASYAGVLDAAIARGAYDHVIPISDWTLSHVWREEHSWSDRAFPRIATWQRSLLLDKRAMCEFAAANGAHVPRIRSATATADVDAAARELGFPFVVKGTWSGGGGSAVRIVRSIDEAHAAVATIRAETGSEPFLQEYIEGAIFSVGGLFEAGRAVRLFAAEVVESAPPVTGPPVLVRSTRDERMLQPFLDVLAALQWTGFAQGDFIQRKDGRFAFLEINPRPWGSIAAAASCGVEFFEPFDALLRGRPAQPSLAFDEGRTAALFPQRLRGHLRARVSVGRRMTRVLLDRPSWRTVRHTDPRLLLLYTRWMYYRYRDLPLRHAATRADDDA